MDFTDDENSHYNVNGEWGYVCKRSNRSITSELKNYHLGDEIKNMADTIYKKMKPQVRRGKKRQQMLFFCVYCAHMELNKDINPIELGKMFGLKQGEVQRCDSLFSPLQTGYHPPSKTVTPISYLKKYSENINLSQETGDQLVALGIHILAKEPSLAQDSPQTVAAGMLRYFIVTNGILISDATIVPMVTNRSNVTIDCMYKKIALIDNR